MTRISLKEAYDNKDVAVQIFGLKDDVARIDEVIENLPNPDLTNCVIKDTEQTITGEKTFTKKIHAEGGIKVNTEGGFEVDGPLTVNGDIIQNGQAYETHAEQVFSQNDLIVTRDGAVSALPAGVVSGIQIKKYDGVNDARLAVDNAGVARVGDVGDEQPLMTRAEVADMVGGAFLKWDAVHAKAVSGTLDDSVTAGSSNGVKSSGIKSAIDDAKTAIEGELATVEGNLETAIAGKVSGTGNIGSDTKPVKIVNGQAVAISDNIPVSNTTQTYSETVTASPAVNVLMQKSVPSAGVYLIITQIEIANAPSGTAILGIAKTSNLGWGISKTNTTTDYVRLTMTNVQTLTASEQVFINLYNGFGSNQSVICRTTITKLA